MTSQPTTRHHHIRLALTAACLLAATASCERIERALYDRAAARAATPDRTDWLSDGDLHVVLCGTGSPIADPSRASSCTAVLAAGRLFLVDVGPGAWENIALWQMPRAHLRAVFLTHFHSDHIGDLGETVVQSWISGRREPLVVFGPPGVGDVVDGFNAAYAADARYRVAHHGAEVLPPLGARAEPATFTATAGEMVTVFDADGLTVRAFRVDHDPVDPAVGYRFDYAGRSVVISGDTDYTADMIEPARGADLIVHEALAKHIIEGVSAALTRRGDARLARLTRDILDYHASPVEAATVAREAGARMLALTHLVPPVPNRFVARIFLQGTADAWDGPIVLGEDGMYFHLPQGSTEITRENL